MISAGVGLRNRSFSVTPSPIQNGRERHLVVSPPYNPLNLARRRRVRVTQPPRQGACPASTASRHRRGLSRPEGVRRCSRYPVPSGNGARPGPKFRGPSRSAPRTDLPETGALHPVFRLPQASSPSTEGCISTRPPSSAVASAGPAERGEVWCEQLRFVAGARSGGARIHHPQRRPVVAEPSRRCVRDVFAARWLASLGGW